MVASELLLLASNDSKQFHSHPVQGGIATFHLRRQYILNIIGSFVGDYIEQGHLEAKINTFLKFIEAGPTSLFNRTLAALRSIENNLVSLDEKESRGAVLGLLESPDFRNQLKLQRDFLLSEHQNLSHILNSIIQRGNIKYTTDFIALIRHIRQLSSYNTILIHYIPAIHSISLLLDPYLSQFPEKVDLPAIANIAKEFKEASNWKLGYWKGAVQLIFYTYASGLHRSKYIESDGSATPNGTADLDIKTDLQDPIRQSIDDGALELLLFIASDIRTTPINFEPFVDFRPELKFCVPEFKALSRISPEFLALLYSSLEKLTEGIITNLADTLREMRLNEEDMYLANGQQDLFDGRNYDENISGIDLERFFIFVCCLYYDRPDAALSFWTDPESDLYNFVLWASQCDIVLMATAFSAMLASLASGPACAFAVHKFLSEHATNPSFASRTRRIAKLSWNRIFSAISENMKTLKPPQPPPSSLLLSKAKVIADIPELDIGVVWILTTYLQILSQVVKYSPEARGELLLNHPISPNTTEARSLNNEAPIHRAAITAGSAPPATSSTTTSLIPLGVPPPLPNGFNVPQPTPVPAPSAPTEPSHDRSYIPIVPVLFEFLSFYTPLFGSTLYTLSGFALSDSQLVKDSLWLAMDQWFFNTTIAFPQNEYLSADVPPKERISRLMSSFSTVYGFVTLLEALLRPSPDQDSGLYSLPFPENFGGKYRSPGFWPYLDFVINEVFLTSATSASISDQSKKLLQQPTLQFILHCLQHFDPEIPIISASAGIDTNLIVKAQSFQDFILVHPSSITMSYLFSSKVYTPLIEMASVDVESIVELPESDPTIVLLIDSLRIINDILNLQNIFIDTVKKASRTSDSGPVHLSTHGLSSFEDAILFNLSIVSQLALYAGSANVTLARLSLNLLDRVSRSSQFSTPSYSTVDSRIRGNRLLSMLEAVDDSVRIKEGLIEQLERPLDSYVGTSSLEAGMQIKEDVLNFLISNLPSTYKEPSISHLLLGFKINSAGSLSLDESRGGALSEVSILQTVLLTAFSANKAVTRSNISYRPSRIASLCYKIVRLLIKNPLSTSVMLDYLRDKEFFLTSLKTEPIVDLRACWDDLPFQDTTEFYMTSSARSLLSFIDKRASLLECLSIELHAAAISGSLSLVSRYMEALANMNLKRSDSFGTSSATKILSFLDIIEYTIPTKERLNEEITSTFGEQVVAHYLRRESELDDETAIAELRYLLRLKGLEFIGTGHIKSLNDPDFITAVDSVIGSFTRNRILDKLRSSQLACLQAWSKLLLVIVNDADMAPNDRTNLLLEAFQAVLHKLKQYASNDAEYAENLASLLVSLYSIYLGDIYSMERTVTGKNLSLLKKNSAERTLTLFKAVITSILTPISTPQLRSELYVIAYKYLKNVLSDESLTANSPIIRACLQSIRVSGDKLIEFVCTDALNGESTTRLTAYILLEVFSTLSIRAKSTFLLDTLVKYNMLLLIVRSILHCDDEIAKRDDSMQLSSALSKSKSHLSSAFVAAKRHYEIMIFKSIMSLLLQLARTRNGAHHITQCGLFEILKTCKFLRIDPDVGIDVRSAFSPALTKQAESYWQAGQGDALRDFGAENLRHFSSVLFRHSHEFGVPLAYDENGAGFAGGLGGGLPTSVNSNSVNSLIAPGSAGSATATAGASLGEAAAPSFAIFLHDPQATFYYLVGPTFQLITATLLSLGSENEPVISRVRSFLQSHELLIVALLRKDVLARGKTESGDGSGNGGSDETASAAQKKQGLETSYETRQQMVRQDNLSSLVKHIVLLISLTGYVPGITQN